MKAFVLRRFLNSEVYNTIVLFVCQQLFSFFSIFSILLFVSHIAAGRAVVFIKIIQKEAAENAMHLLPLLFYIIYIMIWVSKHNNYRP